MVSPKTLMSAELIGRENPHTQATAISWLVSSLVKALGNRSENKIAFESCINWLIDYESYPMDSILESLKAGLKIHFNDNTEHQIERMVKDLIGEYYDRKIS
jgi:hypothetical protein